MTISIFGTNGMLSSYLANYFFHFNNKSDINLYGLESPGDNNYTSFKYTDLLKDEIDYLSLIKSDLIIYAAGAGVQASVSTDTGIIYDLNIGVPVKICNSLKKNKYNGVYISFGSYMEIGLNDDESIFFDEKQIELSSLPITNEYALSKRLLTRFMAGFLSTFRFWHFILPNVFVKNETGSRLIPYVLNYLKKVKNGELCDVPKFSAGNQIRQYINFEDVCFSMAKSLDVNIPSGIYNIGGGEILSIRQLIGRLFNYYQQPISEEMFGREIRHDGEIKSLKLNGDKLKASIGYSPHQRIESIL